LAAGESSPVRHVSTLSTGSLTSWSATYSRTAIVPASAHWRFSNTGTLAVGPARDRKSRGTPSPTINGSDGEAVASVRQSGSFRDERMDLVSNE